MTASAQRPTTRRVSRLPIARDGGRSGLSLLELMLVLAMLVVIGALALPAFRGPFANQRLRKAGELVRVEWCKARNLAMKTGQIQLFQYEADGRSYQIEPYLTEQDWLEADRETAQSLELDNRSGELASPNVAGVTRPAKQLPEGVIFAGGAVESTARLLQMEQELTGNPTVGSQNTVPILFYPDGTSSDTRLVLANQQQYFVQITLRGLTGIAKVSELLTYDELAQIPSQ